MQHIILEAEGQLGLAYLYARERHWRYSMVSQAHSDSVEALGLRHDLTVRLALLYFMSLMATAPFEKSFDFYFKHLRWLQDQDFEFALRGPARGASATRGDHASFRLIQQASRFTRR